MPTRKMPNLPIPPPLRGIEENTWANYSITVRLPEIGQRVIAENHFNPVVNDNLKLLINGIPAAHIREIIDPTAPDSHSWNTYCSPYLGLNWLEPPWFFAEIYFYRRILEATGYFQNGIYQLVDPYNFQKQQGLVTSIREIQSLCSQLEEILPKMPGGNFQNIRNTITQLLYVCLWGNSIDLSIWPVTGNKLDKEKLNYPNQNQPTNILVEETDKLLEYLGNQDKPLRRIDFILDNAGYELVCDFALMDFLLESGLVNKIYIHPKSHPTFVSDVIRQDIEYTVTFLKQAASSQVKSFGGRLQSHFQNQQLIIKEDEYWTSPLSGWEMPENLYQGLGQSDLIISKGDALYRRWLGDRHWPYTTAFTDIMAYMPAPILTLRTLKAQVVSGLQTKQIIELNSKDPDWMINGHWGVIQFDPQK